MVDYAPWNGNYSGTHVYNNTINAQGALIKIAVGMGPRTWPAGSGCPTTTNNGGSVTNNTLTGTHMGYGFTVDGVSNWTVTGNVDNSTHIGTPTQRCSQMPPAPAGFQKHGIHATGVFQSQFVEGYLESLLGLH
jgi:hypothetical protein